MTHAPLYWPTRIYIARLHRENAEVRLREANERLERLIAEASDPWWVRAARVVLRWIGR